MRLAAFTVAAFVSATALAQEAPDGKTPSGRICRHLKGGNGASPAATDTVRVRCPPTDGAEFDSSYGRRHPTELDGLLEELNR